MRTDVRLCPDCGAEFHAHVAACSDCGTPLVAPDAPDPLAFHEGLVAVSYADGPMARRYVEALTAAGVPWCPQWVQFASGDEDHLLFVRPADEAEARRLADAVEAPSIDTRVAPDETFDDATLNAAFDVPDVAPGPEEEAALQAAHWAVGMILAGAAAALLGAFVVDGALGLALALGGAALTALSLTRRARHLARAAELRAIRERTAVGIDPESAPARLDDGPAPTIPGI